MVYIRIVTISNPYTIIPAQRSGTVTRMQRQQLTDDTSPSTTTSTPLVPVQLPPPSVSPDEGVHSPSTDMDEDDNDKNEIMTLH
jgi:hypothetical protein